MRKLFAAMGLSVLLLAPWCAAQDGDLAAQVRELLRVQQEQNRIQQEQAALIEQLKAELDSLKVEKADAEVTQGAIELSPAEKKKEDEEDELRGQEEAPAEAPRVAEKPALVLKSWSDRIRLAGDFRLRFEHIYEEKEDSLTRVRLRARLALKAKLTDTLDFGFQLASGSQDSPTSTNQTFGDAFSSKDVWIDLAYVDWRPERVDGLHLIGGKMVNPFYRPQETQLIWDNDLRLEGGAFTYDRALGRTELAFRGGAFAVETPKDASDTTLFAGQIMGRRNFENRNAYLLGGSSIYYYDNLERRPLLYNASNPFGNAWRFATFGDTTSELLYLQGFNEVELFAVAGMDVKGVPVSVFGDWVRNTEADFDDTGWLAGFKVGRVKDPKSWEVRYSYRYLERNAVVGVFADSNFIGGDTNETFFDGALSPGGGTDGKGHKIDGTYQLSNGVQIVLTYYDNKMFLPSDNKWYFPQLLSRDYRRFIVDLKFRF